MACFQRDKVVSFGSSLPKNKHFNLTNQAKLNSYLGEG
jgi:hypothetical protein